MRISRRCSVEVISLANSRTLRNEARSSGLQTTFWLPVAAIMSFRAASAFFRFRQAKITFPPQAARACAVVFPNPEAQIQNTHDNKLDFCFFWLEKCEGFQYHYWEILIY